MNLVYFGHFNSYHVEFYMSHKQRQRYLKILKEIKDKENDINSTVNNDKFENITSQDLIDGKIDLSVPKKD